MQIKLENVRLSFPNLFTPRTMQEEGKEPAYDASFIFEKDSDAYAKVVEALKAVAKEKWGDKADATLKSLQAGGKTCLKDGAVKAHIEGYEGKWFVSARSKKRPVVIDRDKTPLQESDGKPYAGCFVNAIVTLWAQDNNFGRRINAMLGGVQFLADGAAFGGGGITADAFEALAGVPSVAADDDVGF